jgi:hypothetical protein
MSGPRREDGTSEHPELEPVGTGGTLRAAAASAALVVALGLLAWHPWGSSVSGTPSQGDARATEIARAPEPSAAGGEPSGSPVAIIAPDASSSPVVAPGLTADYRSLVDNEWTIVALLTPGSTASEEPVIPHVPPPAWSADGPFLILQQGLGGASTEQRSAAGGPGGVCSVAAPPRDRPAVHLPADRVAYLGLTYPGMSGTATIRVAVLGVSGARIVRVPAPVVRLDGITPSGRYVLPSAGPGGAALFASSRPGIIPTDAYRFEVTLPGSAAPRYLYACIGT